MPKLKVCLLWHLHQPIYREPESGEYILPWVRLHGTRAYYDMPRVLEEFDEARVVINIAPSLLLQLEQYARGTAQDRFLELSRRHPGELTEGEREFLLRNFFLVDWETNVRALPRYWELLHKRGKDLRGVSLSRVARGFSVSELRDLQVLFNLVWMGFKAEEEEPVVRALKEKARDFSDEDKEELLACQQRILQGVIPALERASREGKVELSVSPFYHPIVPLVMDTHTAWRAMPDASLPPRFCSSEDAREQVRRALCFAEEHLGTRPVGMWPPEGGVSPETLALFAEEGVQWSASDEQVLLRSLPEPERSPAAVHRAYRVRAGQREISMVFRDRGLSELIGFHYARCSPQDAVKDFLRQLHQVAQSSSAEEGALVTIILDGENGWEHYPSSGRDFLRQLYQDLGQARDKLEMVHIREHLLRHPPREIIREIHSGSWIDANFRIWIGHPEENLAWTFLGEVRHAIQEKERQLVRGGGAELLPELARQVAAAREALYVAEGSDWFWWYGDDFSTQSFAEFDALFRAYLKAAWRALGEPVSGRLDESIVRISEPDPFPDLHEPQGFIHPCLDGQIRSFFEWTGAGIYYPRESPGNMFRSKWLFRALRYGFDQHSFFLRLDPLQPLSLLQKEVDLLRLQLESREKHWEVDVPVVEGELPVDIRPAALTGDVLDSRIFRGRACFQDILEVGIPFQGLALQEGSRVALAVHAIRNGIEVERLPRHGYLSFVVPDADYERKFWKV